MDYLDEIGSLALGSRLKRLSERLCQEVSNIYKAQGIDLEPRWFPVFRFVAEKGKAAITDIAIAVGVTHPAVNQIAQEMIDAGLVVALADPSDKRKRLLSLSANGKRLHGDIKRIWKALHASISDVVEESQSNLLNSVIAFERALDRSDLLSRFDRLSPIVERGRLTVVEYGPLLSSHFLRLNRAWIEKYFSMEEADWALFANPGKVLEDGGMIFFARLGDKIVGTCALLKLGNSTFQVAKMAVDEAYQGRQIGKELLNRCVEYAREAGASRVTLETNTKLKAAVSLYRRFGFQPVETDDCCSSEYVRCNLFMTLSLNQPENKETEPLQRKSGR